MNLKVLFLDDEIDLCEIFCDFFSTPNIEIITFTDSEKAIDYSHNNDLDLIVLDYRLPKTNGDIVAARMPRSIPKYLLTGELEVEPEFDFVSVLRKPFEGKEIKRIIDETMKNKQLLGKKYA